MDTELKDYEVSFLGRDEKVAEVLLAALKRHGAEVLIEGPVEKIALEYKIQHESSAYFGYIHFRVAPAAAKALEQELSTETKVLRSLVITPPFQKQKPRWEGRPMTGRTREAAPAAEGIASPTGSSTTPADHRPAAAAVPLSNEALEKRIEEILK